MIIKTVDACKDYVAGDSRVTALNKVSLQIERGEFVAIAGPSGSGKTTLLNMIGCLDSLTSGEVYIDKQQLGAISAKERTMLRRNHIGFIFQSFNLIPVMTAAENVGLALSLLKQRDSEVKARVDALLAEVGLKGMEGRRPSALSGGQQQRVAIARALVKQPLIVLADEPTANLDSENGHAILELMQRLNREHGVTFIFSTHDPMVMECAKRLVLMHDGKITKDTTQ